MNLPPRHQAMLQEMGVLLWQPDAPRSPLNQSTQAESTVSQRHITPPAQAGDHVHAKPATVIPPDSRGLPVRDPMRKPAPGRVDKPSASPLTASRTPVTEEFAAVPLRADLPQLGWADLVSTAQTCRACRLCEHRQQVVFGAGTQSEPLESTPLEWMIVGEGPGEQEDLQGLPFVGAAGKLLDHMLAAIGLSRQAAGAEQPSVYVTNVVKCRPPGNRNPLPDEVDTCTTYLYEQIRRWQPKRILALGRFAAQALLKDAEPQLEGLALGKLRGRVYHLGNVPVVVTYHPAYLLRNPAEKGKSWLDLCLAKTL